MDVTEIMSFHTAAVPAEHDQHVADKRRRMRTPGHNPVARDVELLPAERPPAEQARLQRHVAARVTRPRRQGLRQFLAPVVGEPPARNPESGTELATVVGQRPTGRPTPRPRFPLPK